MTCKYRVVSVGRMYKTQVKSLFFFWFDLGSNPPPSFLFHISYYRTLYEAEAAIQVYHKDQYKHKKNVEKTVSYRGK